jgi:hypothetical protein
MSINKAIPERAPVDADIFRSEILPSGQPVVLRGQVADWPIVRAARESSRALADCIRGYDRGVQSVIVEAPASTGGRLFYRDGLDGFNFERKRGGISATIDRLLALADEQDPPRIFIESMPTDEYLPNFAPAHRMELLDPRVRPRIWIGNAITVQTHYDLFYNIACVVGGRRRFTLFPPEQVTNLYTARSSTRPRARLSAWFNPTTRTSNAIRASPKRSAMPSSPSSSPAMRCTSPIGWWHHVQSLTPFNALVNYWWNDAPQFGSPYGALLHAALALRDLPDDQRAVWRALFDNFVFTQRGNCARPHRARQARVVRAAEPEATSGSPIVVGAGIRQAPRVALHGLPISRENS